MAQNATAGTRKTVKDVIADAHIVAPVDLNRADEEATRNNKPLQQVIVDMGLADRSAVLQALAAEWKVKPVYEDIKDGMGAVIGRKLKSFEKDAQKAIRTTSITEDKAAILNSQSENTLVRLFEVK